MIKYSNVAFEPVPQVQVQMMPRSQMVMPNPMPFVPQQMMFANQQQQGVPIYPFPQPYVPQQQQPSSQIAESQIEIDEKFARELQRQLNQ